VVASIPQGQVVVSSSSFHIHYLKKNKQTGGNMEVTAPVLVVKSKDDVEKFLQFIPAALGTLARGAAAASKGIGTKIGVKGATAAGGGAVAARATAPAAGSTTTALQNTSASSGTSMASNSSTQGATQATPVKVEPSQSANPTLGDYGGTDLTAGTNKPMEGDLPNPNKPTPTNTEEMKMTERDVGRMEEMNRQGKTATVGDAENAAKVAVSDATGKQKTRDTLQNVVLAQQMYSGAKAKKDAEAAAEIQRVEGLAENARSKASTGTGGKVAVA
jgi:hypothetical protein